MASTAKNYRIVPKRDFGAGKGFLINGQWVKSGYVVTDGFCNVMPGATWFQTVTEAFRAITIWELAGKCGSEFWRMWRAIDANPELLAEIKKAERFIAGFEGDELQDGVDDLLTGIRSAISKAEARV